MKDTNRGAQATSVHSLIIMLLKCTNLTNVVLSDMTILIKIYLRANIANINQNQSNVIETHIIHMSINKYTTNIQKRKSLILNKCSVLARLSLHSAIEYIAKFTIFEGQQKSITRNISVFGFYVLFQK